VKEKIKLTKSPNKYGKENQLSHQIKEALFHSSNGGAAEITRSFIFFKSKL
jgi:hypothetical protein